MSKEPRTKIPPRGFRHPTIVATESSYQNYRRLGKLHDYFLNASRYCDRLLDMDEPIADLSALKAEIERVRTLVAAARDKHL